MKSRTSFFNYTLFKNNLRRLWPVWAIYTVLMIIIVPMMTATYLSRSSGNVYESISTSFNVATHIFNSLQGCTLIAMFYGVITAMALYGFLFSTRSTIFFHSLPVRRSGIFTTQWISGIVFSTVPNIVVTLILMAVTAGEEKAMEACVVFLGGMCGMEIFFFSFASFVAMFTGRHGALPAFYFILLFLVFVLRYTVHEFLSPCLYGVNGMAELGTWVMWLSPVVCLMSHPSYNLSYGKEGTCVDYNDIQGIEFINLNTYAIYAAVGVVFALLAYIAYEKRRTERSGELITFTWASHLFILGVGFSAAIVFSQLLLSIFMPNENIILSLIFAIIFALIGCIASVMIRDRSARAWKKGIVPFLIVTLLLIGITAGAIFDITGVVRKVPEVGDIKKADVEIFGHGYKAAALYDPENIEKVTQLHSYAISEKGKEHNVTGDSQECITFDVEYTLNDGSFLSRRYSLFVDRNDPDATAYGRVRDIVDSTEFRISSLGHNGNATGRIKEMYLIYFPDSSYDNSQTRYVPSAVMGDIYSAFIEDALNLPPLALTSSEDSSGQYYDNTYATEIVVIFENGESMIMDLSDEGTPLTIAALIDKCILDNEVTLTYNSEMKYGEDVVYYG